MDEIKDDINVNEGQKNIERIAVVTSISINSDMLEAVRTLYKKEWFKGDSEFICHLLREYLKSKNEQ